MIEKKELLRGIRNGDKNSIQQLIVSHSGMLTSFVLRNSGTKDEAKDLMQESMYQLFRALRKDPMPRIDNLNAYFSTIYRNVWMKRLKIKKREESVKDSLPADDTADDENYYKYLVAFEKLGEDCKNVLEFYIQGMKNSQIAEKLNTTEAYAKRKKYLCKEKLKALVQKSIVAHE